MLISGILEWMESGQYTRLYLEGRSTKRLEKIYDATWKERFKPNWDYRKEMEE